MNRVFRAASHPAVSAHWDITINIPCENFNSGHQVHLDGGIRLSLLCIQSINAEPCAGQIESLQRKRKGLELDAKPAMTRRKRNCVRKKDIPPGAAALLGEGRFLGVIVVEMGSPSVAACATF